MTPNSFAVQKKCSSTLKRRAETTFAAVQKKKEEQRRAERLLHQKEKKGSWEILKIAATFFWLYRIEFCAPVSFSSFFSLFLPFSSVGRCCCCCGCISLTRFLGSVRLCCCYISVGAGIASAFLSKCQTVLGCSFFLVQLLNCRCFPSSPLNDWFFVCIWIIAFFSWLYLFFLSGVLLLLLLVLVVVEHGRLLLSSSLDCSVRPIAPNFEEEEGILWCTLKSAAAAAAAAAVLDSAHHQQPHLHHHHHLCRCPGEILSFSRILSLSYFELLFFFITSIRWLLPVISSCRRCCWRHWSAAC